VYAVGHAAVTAEGRELAAVLACGPGATLSHWNAAARWGLLRPTRGPVHVTVAAECRHRVGIRVHLVEQLHPSERTLRDAIPVTSVPRTLLDVAAVATPKALARAVNQADRLGWLNRGAIERLCLRNRGRRGVKRLRAALEAAHPSTGRTRSDLEADFLVLCRDSGLPSPAVNTTVEGYEVDMHWPGTRLIVEIDGFEYHRTRASFERDRRRDAELKLRGYQVLRVTDAWLAGDPAGVATTVRMLLGL
jgi:very-short-patch-repair endonuclease